MGEGKQAKGMMTTTTTPPGVAKFIEMNNKICIIYILFRIAFVLLGANRRKKKKKNQRVIDRAATRKATFEFMFIACVTEGMLVTTLFSCFLLACVFLFK